MGKYCQSLEWMMHEQNRSIFYKSSPRSSSRPPKLQKSTLDPFHFWGHVNRKFNEQLLELLRDVDCWGWRLFQRANEWNAMNSKSKKDKGWPRHSWNLFETKYDGNRLDSIFSETSQFCRVQIIPELFTLILSITLPSRHWRLSMVY
jgi:hypothetical protein